MLKTVSGSLWFIVLLTAVKHYLFAQVSVSVAIAVFQGFKTVCRKPTLIIGFYGLILAILKTDWACNNYMKWREHLFHEQSLL